MSGIRWTDDQERAIAIRGRHTLVSAAAGSGKTAVLIERIVRRITQEGGDIDRLLVVTFTDAAAAQMRDRLVQRIHERLADTPGDTHLLRQLMLLPSASISTLHAFCLKVVRQHFYRLGLDPAFRLLDEHEAQLLRQEALEEALENMYETMRPGDPFARLVTAYGGAGSDDELQRFLLNMHDYSRSLPDPAGWLRSSVAPYAELDTSTFDASPWAAELQQHVLIRLARAERLLRQALAAAMSPGGSPNHAETYEADIEQLQTLQDAARAGWSVLAENVQLFTFGRLKAARNDGSDADVRKRGTDLRNRAKDIVEKDIRDVLLSKPLADELEALRDLAAPLEALAECVIRWDEVYKVAKNERGLIDFSDIEHLCLELLDVPEVAEEVSERFDEVLIDECQDLNGVQDAILARISRRPDAGGELFLVGDVKQSVYRFRQADPSLFMARYEKAGAGEDDPERRIDLQANFRSREGIISAVNFLFRQLMTEAAGEMDYGPEAELVAGATYPPDVADPPVEFHVLERERRLLAAEDGANGAAGEEPGAHLTSSSGSALTSTPDDDANPDDDLTAFQREARYAAQHIQRIIRDEKTQVWDNGLGRYRPARYGDVVVLLRVTRGRANELVDELQLAGIPAYAELGTGYFAATEVETMLALLRVLDNPRQDIPLAAVLRTIVGLSPEELAHLRIYHRGGDLYDAVQNAASADVGHERLQTLPVRLSTFLATLDEWRTLARRAPLSKVVWRLLAETRYFDYVGALPGGRQRQANLRALYERAQQFNHFSRHGLSRFLRFIERLQDADGDLGTAPALGEADDVVRIMSVHKSKGLEFPIVYVLGSGREFGGGGKGHRDLALHRQLGLGAGLVDGERRIAQPSLLLKAVQWRQQREELAEEMRVLYVALTRARERLVVIGSVSNIDQRAADWAEAASGEGWPLDDERLLTAGSWMDWIGPAVMRHEGGAPLRERAEAVSESVVRIADRTVAADASSWEVHVGGQPGHVVDVSEASEPPLAWPALAALQPLPNAQPPRPEASVSEPAEAMGSSLPETPAAAVADRNGTESAGQEVAAGRDGRLADKRVADFSGSEHVLDRLQQRLGWVYPHKAVVGLAAKQSVSELKRRWDAANADESAPVASFRRRLDDRPAFLQTAGRQLTAAERGSAVHLVLQHADLAARLDRSGLADQVRDLEARQMLTPEQAAAVDVESLAAFFASPLGSRLQAHPQRVRREVPFTMAVPAVKAYRHLTTDAADGEAVIVQGIIDCLVEDDDGLLLIDFKTDRVSEATVAGAAAGYASQVRLYAEAVNHMYDRPVAEAYLVFLAIGRAIPM